MKITNKKKITNFLNLNLKLIALSSLIFSQLSLSEIFLYQNDPSSLSVNIAKADVSDTWYNPAWSYRKQITLNSAKVPSTQTNFPVLISLVDDSLKTAPTGKVHDANGYDIIFTSQSGTKLDHEIESYDGSTGTINMWVRIPTLSHDADTLIYIYYGNSAISATQEAVVTVWDSNTKLVQHMNQDPSGAGAQMLDSTSNNNDGTSGGTMTTADLVAGKIGGALDFDGTDDYVNAGVGSNTAITNNLTFAAWVKPVANNPVADSPEYGISSIFCFKNANNGFAFIDSKFRFRTSAGGDTYLDTSDTYSLNNFYFVVGTYDGTNMNLYIDGVNKGTLAQTGNLTLYNYIMIGSTEEDIRHFNGTIDEVRISNTARSADWIATEYNNQSDPSDFLALSPSQEEYLDRMDHLAITAGTTTQIAGATQTLTLTAINIAGATNTLYAGNQTITLSGANAIGSHTPTFTDNTHEVNLDSSGTILFTNGVAHTNIKLYKAENAEIDITDGTYSTTGNASYDLNVTVSPATVNSFTISSPATVTSETPFSLTLTAKDSSGNTTTGVINSTTLSVNQGAISTASIPNTGFTTNGIYTNDITVSNIAQNANITLTVANGSVSNTQGLAVIGVSHSSGFFPQKPVIDSAAVTIGNLSNLPDNITQVAISRTPDFTNVSWQDFDKDKFSHLNENTETLYFKFRTSQGAVSDVVIYTPQPKNQTLPPASMTTLNDGDIVKTISSPDVYVIKIKNNKEFKRLILSPKVFQSYQHLKWENIKTVSQEELNQYATSDLVKETTDTVIYELFPNGDTGERKLFAATYDADSVYEINQVDRDSYILVK